MKPTVLAAAVSGLFVSGAATAQTGTLILEDYFDQGFFLIQGGEVIRSFPRADGSPNGPASPFVGIDTIKSSPQHGGGTGFEYSLTGDILNKYEVPSHGGNHDAGTDGRAYIYNSENFCGTGSMWRMDLDWQNPELLFTYTPLGACALGTAYDLVNDTIWIQSYGPSTIAQYDFAGNVLSSFDSIGESLGLAYEPETDTLWTADSYGSNRIAQYDKKGNLLQEFEVKGLPPGVYHTAEFVVAPRGGDCYADLNGDTVLDLFDFLEFTNLFNAGDETANCDGQGGLDLFDFLCFTNEFNAGC
jgi:hypothetical protein